MTSNVVEVTNGIFGTEDIDLLHDVNFSIMNAEFCYLTGKSGSGKTTLLKTLYGEYSLKAGNAHVTGVDLTRLKRSEVPDLRRRIGMVFQDFRLFYHWTVQKNLSFVLRATGWDEKDKAMQRIEEVLLDVQLHDKLDRLAYTLSGGEQQRLCIARALLNTPQLIIADEPTGHLDPTTSDEVFDLIKEVNETHGTATIFATHDTRLMERWPARHLQCEEQTIIEQ